MAIIISESLFSHDFSSFKEEIEGAESLKQIKKILNSNNLDFKLIKVGDNEILIFDDYIIDDFDFPDLKTKEEYLYDWQTIVDIDFEEKINNDFWENPTPLYHGTNSNNVNNILKNGLETRNKTRGINNRSIGSAIFTVSDINRIISSYDKIIKIDTETMKANGFTPYITKEPEYVEELEKEYIAKLIELNDFYIQLSNDIFEETYIFFEDIPSEYLSLI